MRHESTKPPTSKYIRRVTSNGADVYPTVCATQYKGVQSQMDKSGYYILDYIRKINITPLTADGHKCYNLTETRQEPQKET